MENHAAKTFEVHHILGCSTINKIFRTDHEVQQKYYVINLSFDFMALRDGDIRLDNFHEFFTNPQSKLICIIHRE